jgi:hypothetical protein
MNTEPQRFIEGTRTTRQLSAGDWVIAPDGARRGMVRHTYPGGVLGEHPGQTTVQFQVSSVFAVGGGELPRPRAWVTCDDDADWRVERWAWRPEEPEHVEIVGTAALFLGVGGLRRTP